MNRRIQLHSENSRWLLSRIYMMEELCGVPWFLEGGMMDDVHSTIDAMDTDDFPTTWKTMFFNLYEDSHESMEFEEFLTSLERVCRHCDETRESNRRSADLDLHQLQEIRKLWRMRAYRYAKRIELTGIYNSAMCYSKALGKHLVSFEEINHMYQLFDIVSLSIKCNSILGDETMNILKYAARNESHPFSMIFMEVYEDANIENPMGTHGNILTFMVAKFGNVRTARALRDVYEHKESEASTNILHMVAINNPELLFQLVPYFQEKWSHRDAIGNSPLENALLSKKFRFETCGYLLIHCDDSQLKQIHHQKDSPLCVLMIESADLSTVYYLIKRMTLNYFL